MKEVRGRSRVSGTVIKKKTSSGCLVIKKVTDDVTRFRGSSSRNLSKSPKEKKRSRVVESESSDSSDSESSDSSSETIRPNGDEFHNGQVPCKGASSGLDVFEFDEYDRFDDNRITRNANDGRYRWNSYRQSGNRTESGSGGSRLSRFEIEEDDESDLPLSVFRKKHRLSSGKSIRLQGKNGVLKVMVNKSKQVGVSHSSHDHAVAHNSKKPKPRVTHNNKRSGMKPSFYSDSEDGGKLAVSKSKEKAHSRGESVKSEEIVKEESRTKGTESKVKRGSGTEKQVLREKIKNMLVAAGWSIDYRRRRNRDYMDAVYISPSGTGYWSIVKAYDAFQKEEEGNSKDCGGFLTPLRDEILGKLTRQTQKKKEVEMKSKRKVEDEKEEDLNSYGRKSRKIGRCSLLVRDYDKAENDDGFVPYSGKRTLLSWLIDSGVVRLREPVEYVSHRKTQILQKGWITKDGIRCGCCSNDVSVLKFEVHAGSKLGDPFPNIFLESGKSLMQCQIDAWNKQGELERKGFYTVDADGDDPNDDTCGLCGDGGDLICCDGCPSTFHQACLDLLTLPQGDWFCPNCSCKYCEIAFTNSTQAALLTCHLCQKKYHESCRPEIEAKPIESSYPNLSFCGHPCHELYGRLQKLVGVKHELDSEFSWSLIHRSEISMDESSVLLAQRVECNSMLAVAMSVMDECFLPFTDRRTRINLIRNVIFNCGSNLSRLNYSGFFTAILKRGDEVVCAASIRILGTQLAEMPFIGTRHMYRRQGMCRRLLMAIEMALSSLHVEKLMIPAIPEHMDTWTDVFGFRQLEESDKQELRCMNMVVFPRTDMLKKPLPKAKTDSGSQDYTTAGTLPINSPSEPKLSGSHSEPNVHESTVQVANALPSVIPGEPELQFHSNTNLEETDDTTTETLPVNSPSEPKVAGSHSEPNVDESTVQVANAFPSVIPGEPELQVRSNTNLEETGSQDDTTTETLPINSASEPKLAGSHSEPNVDESTVQVAIALPSVIPVEPELQLHSNTKSEETDV